MESNGFAILLHRLEEKKEDNEVKKEESKAVRAAEKLAHKASKMVAKFQKYVSTLCLFGIVDHDQPSHGNELQMKSPPSKSV